VKLALPSSLESLMQFLTLDFLEFLWGTPLQFGTFFKPFINETHILSVSVPLCNSVVFNKQAEHQRSATAPEGCLFF
jgi:hypothetical protein